MSVFRPAHACSSLNARRTPPAATPKPRNPWVAGRDTEGHPPPEEDEFDAAPPGGRALRQGLPDGALTPYVALALRTFAFVLFLRQNAAHIFAPSTAAYFAKKAASVGYLICMW